MKNRVFLIQLVFVIVISAIFSNSISWGLAPSSEVLKPRVSIAFSSYSSDISDFQQEMQSFEKVEESSVEPFEYEKETVKNKVIYFCIFASLFLITYFVSKFNPYSFVLLGVAFVPFGTFIFYKIAGTKFFRFKMNPLWDKTFGRALEFVRESIKFMFLFIVIYAALVVFLHLGIDTGSLRFTAEVVEKITIAFTVLSIPGIILFAMPIIVGGHVAFMSFLDALINLRSPWEEIDEEFTQGLALFLLLFLYFIMPSLDMELVSLALVAVIIHTAELMEDKMVASQMASIKTLKSESVSNKFEIVSLNDERDCEPLSVQQIENALGRGIRVVVRIKANTSIPKLDGVVLKCCEKTRISTAALTGESAELTVKVGDKVKGGSMVLGDFIEMEVTEAGSKTTLGQMEMSLTSLDPYAFSEVKALSDKVLKYFGLVLFAVAFVGFIILKDWLIVVGALAGICACPFLIGVPLSFVVARHRLASENIYVRKNSAFSPVNVLVLDKTGTITDDSEATLGGNPFVLCPSQKDLNDDTEALQRYFFATADIEAPLEESSLYSRLLIDFAKSKDYLKQEASFSSFSGGVSGQSRGLSLFIGNYKQLKGKYGMVCQNLNEIREAFNEVAEAGLTPIILYDVNKQQAVGCYRVSQKIREGFNDLVGNFLNMGDLKWYHRVLNAISQKVFRFQPYPEKIYPVVASGDTKFSVREVLKRSSMSFGLAEVTPEEKAKFVYWLSFGENLKTLQSFVSSDEIEDSQRLPLVMNWDEFEKNFLPKELKRRFEITFDKRLEKEQGTMKDRLTRVGMVGDGTNDTIALSLADVAFSFSSATDFAKTVANVVLGKGKDVFKNLKKFLKLQRRSYSVIFVNIFLVAFLWNIVIVSLIFAKVLTPQYVAICHALNTLLVIFVAFSLKINLKKIWRTLFKKSFFDKGGFDGKPLSKGEWKKLKEKIKEEVTLTKAEEKNCRYALKLMKDLYMYMDIHNQEGFTNKYLSGFCWFSEWLFFTKVNHENYKDRLGWLLDQLLGRMKDLKLSTFRDDIASFRSEMMDKDKNLKIENFERELVLKVKGFFDQQGSIYAEVSA
ncbi:hypothetical protein AB834_04680 [PVC group bacterium (ex Bugula neritina AB1)]|nr:hypothetical protein AB834_04680 [PVC group bacterium (ex Bugula neritina AB1)]